MNRLQTLLGGGSRLRAPKSLVSGYMNYKLYRLHRVLAVAYAAFIIIFALFGMVAAINHGEWQVGLIGLGVLPIAVVHWCAAMGARRGKRWGGLLPTSSQL